MNTNSKCSHEEAARGTAIVSEVPVACRLLLKANCVFLPIKSRMLFVLCRTLQNTQT